MVQWDDIGANKQPCTFNIFYVVLGVFLSVFIFFLWLFCEYSVLFPHVFSDPMSSVESLSGTIYTRPENSSRPSNTSSQGARFDFLYGPEDWGFLPYWAHVVPIFIAQFHTLLCIIFLCNGLPYVLGFCQETWSGNVRLWWRFFWGVDAHRERGRWARCSPKILKTDQTWLEMTCFTWFFSFFL